MATFNSFLHGCTERKNPIINQLMEKFGPYGYTVYFILKEMLLGDEENGFMYYFGNENKLIEEICKESYIRKKQKTKVKEIILELIKKGEIMEEFYNIGILYCDDFVKLHLKNIKNKNNWDSLNQKMTFIFTKWHNKGIISQEIIDIWAKKTGNRIEWNRIEKKEGFSSYKNYNNKNPNVDNLKIQETGPKPLDKLTENETLEELKYFNKYLNNNNNNKQ